MNNNNKKRDDMTQSKKSKNKKKNVASASQTSRITDSTGESQQQKNSRKPEDTMNQWPSSVKSGASEFAAREMSASVTKLLTQAKITPDVRETGVQVICEQRFGSFIEKIETDFACAVEALGNELDHCWDNCCHWLPIENRRTGNKLYYQMDTNSFLPDLADFELSSHISSVYFDINSAQTSFYGFEGTIVTGEELVAIFNGGKWVDWLQKNYGFKFHRFYTLSNSKSEEGYIITGVNGREEETYGYFSPRTTYDIPLMRLGGEGRISPAIVLNLFLRHEVRNGSVKKDLWSNLEEYYREFSSLITFHDAGVTIDIEEFRKRWQKGELDEWVETEQDVREHIEWYIESGMFAQPILQQKLLECEYARCALEPYDQQMLNDPQRGHWDLWEQAVMKDKGGTILDPPLMARDPHADIREGGVVGIDFGTKSTVVVYQADGDYTMPMRIGTGLLTSDVESAHFENPTVLELIDLISFLEAYCASPGRPDTKWEQATTSHTAQSDLDGCDSTDYYAFLHELKQWAGDRKRRLRLRDKKGNNFEIPTYLEIKDGEFDPIELYAYYIGLYINNMRNGIYINYQLSFPVTYEKATQDKILRSFERGIKKSLPATILNDSTVMEAFLVEMGSSEPTAYAVCALQEFAVKPDDEDRCLYSVFDFGGGTSDFDYGIWRNATPSERRYDYVLESLRSGGDQYLGGENLLELLAYTVFKRNLDTLREKQISFILPPECNPFPGSEVFLNESQEARRNMKQLAERLRPFWESEAASQQYEDMQPDDYPHSQQKSSAEKQLPKVELDLLNDKVIKNVMLYDRAGKQRNVELNVDIHELRQTLYDRITRGVVSFFEGLRLTYALPETEGLKRVNILLAGNSSKSPIINEVLEKYCNEKAANILNIEKGDDIFVVYPPLGTDAAENLIAARNVEGSDLYPVDSPPTGKTGVAFGLVFSRPGSRIKVVRKNLDTKTQETKFRFYIGQEVRKNFIPIPADGNIDYHKWYELTDASVRDFTVYYTNLPEASRGKMSISRVSRKNLRLKKVMEGANIYYRAVTPNQIEYAVATIAGIEKGDYLEPPKKVEL